jgi:hypothetical protein
MRQDSFPSDGSPKLPESNRSGSDPGTRSTWILLALLFAATAFFVWGIEDRVPWVLHLLDWAAVVF